MPSATRVRRRFLHPIWLLTALPGYIGWRLIPPLATGMTQAAACVAVLLGACLLVPMSIGLRGRRSGPAQKVLSIVGLVSIGFFSTLFVLTLLRDVMLLIAYGLGSVDALVIPSARAALLIATLMTVLGFFVARHPRLVHVDVTVANLPATLHGFSIAQISDLHVGPTIKRGFVESIVARVNALQTDAIAITGDLVDGSVADLSTHTEPLAALTARDGVYFVTGNHEYYSGEAAWTEEMRRLGINVLKNEHVVITRGQVSLVLAGITDYTAHHFDPGQASDPSRALLGAPADAPKVLLAHQPNSAPAAHAAGFDLQISGHTHGGQFMPWNWFVGRFQPFTRGLNRLGNLQVYVSRGTGYWGPPNRFGVRGEITRIRLLAT